MKKFENPAILVVDMLNDFVTGALACDRGKAIVPATAELLDAARAAGVPVIFCNDAHIAGIDRELKLWGDHAIAGTEGAKVIPELKVSDKDYVVPKRRYSGFFQTDLDILLKELGVKASCTSCPVYSQFSATAEQTSTAITATTAFRFHLALIDPFLLQIITAILPP